MAPEHTIDVRIREFMLRHFHLAQKNGIRGGEKWLETGMLDSLGILDVVHFLEEEFTIRVSDEELLPENFGSLDVLVEFTRKKLATLAPTEGKWSR